MQSIWFFELLPFYSWRKLLYIERSCPANSLAVLIWCFIKVILLFSRCCVFVVAAYSKSLNWQISSIFLWLYKWEFLDYTLHGAYFKVSTLKKPLSFFRLPQLTMDYSGEGEGVICTEGYRDEKGCTNKNFLGSKYQILSFWYIIYFLNYFLIFNLGLLS